MATLESSAYNEDALQRTTLSSFLPSGRLAVVGGSEELVEALDAAASSAAAGAGDGDARVLVAVPPGEGRAALIANWVARRVQAASAGEGAPTECVAYHFATCSAISADVRVVLHRLVHRLEAFVERASPSGPAQTKTADLPFEESALLERFEAAALAAAALGPLTIAIDAVDAVRGADGTLEWLVGERGLAARLPSSVCLALSVTMATLVSVAEKVATGEVDAADEALEGEAAAVAAVAAVMRAAGPAWTIVAPSRPPAQAERQRTVSYFLDFASGDAGVDSALGRAKGSALGAASAMQGQPALRTFLRALECFASATTDGALAEGIESLAPGCVCAALESSVRAATKRASVEQHQRGRAVTEALVETIVALWEKVGHNATGQARRGAVGFIASQLRSVLMCLATARDGLLFGELMDIVRELPGELDDEGEMGTPVSEEAWRRRAEAARKRNRVASNPAVWRAVLEVMQAVGVVRVGDLLVVARDLDATPLRIWAEAQSTTARASAAATLVAFFVARRESAAATIAPRALAPDGGAPPAGGAEGVTRNTVPPQVAELVAAVERSTAPAPEDDGTPAIVGSAAAAIPAPSVAAARASLTQAVAWRAAAELPWLLAAAGDWATLRGIVAHPLTILSLWSWGEAWESSARSAGASMSECADVPMPTLVTQDGGGGSADEVDSLLSAVLAAESAEAMGRWTCRPDRMMQRAALVRWWRSLAVGLESSSSAGGGGAGGDAKKGDSVASSPSQAASQQLAPGVVLRQVDPVEELSRTALEWATLSVPAPSSCQIHDAVVATWLMLAELASYEIDEGVTPTLHSELKLVPLVRFGISAAARDDTTEITARAMVHAVPPSMTNGDGSVIGVSGATYARRWRWVMWPWLALKVHLNDDAAPMMKRLRDESAYQMRAAEAGVESTERVWNVRKSNIFAEGELTAVADRNSKSSTNKGKVELAGVPVHLRDASTSVPTKGMIKFMMNATLNASSTKRPTGSDGGAGDTIGADGIESGPALKGSEQDVAHEIFKRRKRVEMLASPARKQAASATKAAPFSAPSQRSLKHGTRFPSVERQARDLGERVFPIFQHGTAEPTANTASVIPMPASISTKHLANLPAHLQGHPMNRVEADAARARERLHRVRKKYDSLIHEESVKTHKMEELQQAVLDRQTEDNYTAAEMQAGEATMAVLHDRIRKLAAAIAEAEATGAYYNLIIAQCDVNPPKDEKHIKSIEKAADAATKGLKKASDMQIAAEYELDHLRAQEMPALQAAVAQNRELRAGVIARLEDAKVRLQSEREELGAKQLRRHEIVEDVSMVHANGTKPMEVEQALERLERNSSISMSKMREAALARTREAGTPAASEEEMNAAWARIENICRGSALPASILAEQPTYSDFLTFYRRRDEFAMMMRMERATQRLKASEILTQKREVARTLSRLEVTPAVEKKQEEPREGSPPARMSRKDRRIAKLSSAVELDRAVLIEAVGVIARIAKLCDVPLTAGPDSPSPSPTGQAGDDADDSLLRVADRIPQILALCRTKLLTPPPLKLGRSTLGKSSTSRSGGTSSSVRSRSSASMSPGGRALHPKLSASPLASSPRAPADYRRK